MNSSADIEKLLNIECLVFSAHKTATQTITHSLCQGGTPSLHAHLLENIGLNDGQFNDFLKEYTASTSRKLKIISVFRDPLERLISSFFQSLSVDAYAWVPQVEGEIRSTEQDGIQANSTGVPSGSLRAAMSLEELQELFYRYCETIDGWGESIDYICDELGIAVDNLRFSTGEHINKNQFEDCDLYLLRFDQLPSRLPGLFESIAGKSIPVLSVNVTSSKSYAGQYNDFRKHLRMPHQNIENIYASRKVLIDLFYPGQYESILRERICGYGPA